MSRQAACKRRGFSLSEMLIALTVISMAGAVTVPMIATMTRESRLNSEARLIIVSLRRARQLAAVSPKVQVASGVEQRARVAGIRFDSPTRYAIFVDPDTDPANFNEVDMETIDLADRDRQQKSRITAPALGSQIRFERNGTTSAATIVVEDSERGRKRIISLTAGGQARLD